MSSKIADHEVTLRVLHDVAVWASCCVFQISTIQMDTEDFRIGFHLLWRFAFVYIAEKMKVLRDIFVGAIHTEALMTECLNHFK
jgi:hypothetical protein